MSDPAGAKMATRTFTRATPQGEAITATAKANATGFYTFRIRSTDTPAGNLKPSYKLSVTYRAPQELK